MTLNLFAQFMAPQAFGISLMTLALIMPLLMTSMIHRPTTNRTTALSTYLSHMLTKQLLTPLSKAGHTWALPLLMTMTYLLTLNLLGLLPYTFTPTTQLALNMGLALPMWLMTVLVGLRTQPTMSLAHMLPTGTPTPLVPALIIIETISTLIRPLALGVRLTANLTAGHLLIALISTTALTLLQTSTPVALLTATVLMLLTVLEIAVAVIQAYVFTLLLSLYLQENT